MPRMFQPTTSIYERNIRQFNETGSTTTTDGKVLNANKIMISNETLEKLKKVNVNVSHSD